VSKTTTGAGDGAEHPRRVTLGQVVEMLLQRTGGEHSSVTLSRNAKGETQIEVVVRTAEAGEVTTPDAALDKAMELYNRARQAYPMSSGMVGGESS
jgi:hypothetical protein